jgi:hypothetical protein
MQLHEPQKPERIHLNDDCVDTIAKAPLHDPTQKRVSDRTKHSSALAMPGRDAVARPFPDVGSSRRLAFAEIPQNVREKVWPGRWEHPLVADNLAIRDEKHVDSAVVVKTVSFPTVFPRKVDPLLFFYENLVAELESLIQFRAIEVGILVCHDMQHQGCPLL